MICYRKVLNISYLDHIANEEVRKLIRDATEVHHDLTIVKKQKPHYGQETKTLIIRSNLSLFWHD